jgi:photosystem II stability/assembly factor-like uncharacterized protein
VKLPSVGSSNLGRNIKSYNHANTLSTAQPNKPPRQFRKRNKTSEKQFFRVPKTPWKSQLGLEKPTGSNPRTRSFDFHRLTFHERWRGTSPLTQSRNPVAYWFQLAVSNLLKPMVDLCPQMGSTPYGPTVPKMSVFNQLNLFQPAALIMRVILVSVLFSAIVLAAELPLRSPEDLNDCKIEFVSAMDGFYHCATKRKLFATHDGGINWFERKYPPFTDPKLLGWSARLQVLSATRLVIAVGASSMFSTDAGMTWQMKNKTLLVGNEWFVADSVFRDRLQGFAFLLKRDLGKGRLGLAKTYEAYRGMEGYEGWAGAGSEARLFVDKRSNAFLVDSRSIWVKTTAVGKWSMAVIDRPKAIFESVREFDRPVSLECLQRACWILYADGFLLKSINLGNRWNVISRPAQMWSDTKYLNSSRIQFMTDQNGYLLGADGLIRESIDGGASWRIELGAGEEFVDLSCFAIQHCHVVRSDGILFSLRYGLIYPKQEN